MACNASDINLVVFENYIFSFYIGFSICLSSFLGCVKIYVCVPYFVNFGRFVAQMPSYACGSASSRQISSYWDFMSANVAEIIECWSLMTFICQLSASLKTEQAQICVQPHVQTSFLTWKCIRTSTTLSSAILYVLLKCFMSCCP